MRDSSPMTERSDPISFMAGSLPDFAAAIKRSHSHVIASIAGT
jgi:hypothetical protein